MPYPTSVSYRSYPVAPRVLPRRRRGGGAGAGVGAFMWSDFRGGLGQTDAEYLSAQNILMGMINRESSRIQGLAANPRIDSIRRKIEAAVTWFRGGMEKFYSGDTSTAMHMLTNGITVMHEVSRAVTSLSPGDKVAASAQAVSQQGASFTYQVGETFGAPFRTITDPIASAVESVSPAAAEVVRSAGWALIPIVGGVLLVLLLKR